MNSRGFGSDNHAGVHPEVMRAILEANQGHAHAYGHDPLTLEAQSLFQKHFGAESQTFFVFNGTAANVLALRTLVQSHQAVLCSSTAHLAVDECGAPEFHLGSKLLTVEHTDGKVQIPDLESHMVRLGDQHVAQPKALSITQPTELGTVYSLSELRELREWTRKKGLWLHIDGARLANAACHLNVDFSGLMHAADPDAISFGGTKNGLLGGEAVILRRPQLAKDFKYIHKQEMQLSSKTRFVAAQFRAYLASDLWIQIARHVNGLALDLQQKLAQFSDITIPYPVQSNAVFAQVPKSWTSPLREACFFYVWDEKNWLVRLMMGFDNQPEDIDRFIETASQLHKTHSNRGGPL